MTIMLIRSVIIYILILFVIRLMGKRQVGEMQPFEFVITLIVADLACIPMSELSVPLVHGVVPILALLILHFFICVISRKSMRIRYLISGRPAIVVTPSGIDYNELKKLNMTLDDLIESMRGCDVFAIDEIAYAIIETNGKMCVIPKAMNMPVTKKDLDINNETTCLPINIIMDGILMKENVKISGIDNDFIEDCIRRANAKSIKEILIFTIDNNGKVFIQAKNASEYLTFNTDFVGGNRW